MPDLVPLDGRQLLFKLVDVGAHGVDALLIEALLLKQLVQLSIFHVAEDGRVDPIGLRPEVIV